MVIFHYKDNKKHILNSAEEYFKSKFVPSRTETNENTTRLYWNKMFLYHLNIVMFIHKVIKYVTLDI